ncbi:hypothetical protein [Geobacillus sp. Y412MC52]|jgi:uncharacterized membrane protein YgaE (UPF0421/DUF939 family)|uniref:hypothetical protein n=1 Tax=Geobacillus sp. (strain Y412MC52) TaxID=550542 RepID=UPI0001B9EF2F|nr:hypothetical protein [Geobacillus sp. Y412MC52]ADU95662.1 Apolipoprotein L [Geobacillus sp. Y412MC52]
MLIVRTKEELKRAKENKVKEFIVVGELAQKLHKAEKISKLSKTAAVALAGAVGVGVATTPVTGGVSLGVSALIGTGVAATAGVSTGVIYATIAVGGVLLVYALYKEYNVTVIRRPDGTIELQFNRK